MNNSQFSVLNTINQVDGFDPAHLAVDYVDFTTQETRKRLPVSLRGSVCATRKGKSHCRLSR